MAAIELRKAQALELKAAKEKGAHSSPSGPSHSRSPALLARRRPERIRDARGLTLPRALARARLARLPALKGGPPGGGIKKCVLDLLSLPAFELASPPAYAGRLLTLPPSLVLRAPPKVGQEVDRPFPAAPVPHSPRSSAWSYANSLLAPHARARASAAGGLARANEGSWASESDENGGWMKGNERYRRNERGRGSEGGVCTARPGSGGRASKVQAGSERAVRSERGHGRGRD